MFFNAGNGSSGGSALFGNSDAIFGPATADALFSAGLSTSIQANVLIVKGLQRDLDRLNGYKVDLPPAQKEELEQLQARIGRINERAGPDGVLTDRDAAERTELYQDAYKILGKDYVDVKKDSTLNGLMAKVDTLLEPKLRGAQKTRLDKLRSLESSMMADYQENPNNKLRVNQLRSIQLQIRELTTPRKMTQLSNTERADYNSLVQQINEKAGTDLLLNSTDRLKAEKIQDTIDQLS